MMEVSTNTALFKMILVCLAVWISLVSRASCAPSGNLANPPATVTQHHHWTYQGAQGPEGWALDFPECGGVRQSPIDIRPEHCQYDPSLQASPLRLTNFQIESTRVNMGQNNILTNFTNNGHSAAVQVVGDLHVEGGGLPGQFRTAGFHLHWGSRSTYGSEHAIGGFKYPLEMHVVNYNTKYGTLRDAVTKPDGLAVLAVVFELSNRDNGEFETLEEALKYISKSGDYQLLDGLTLQSLLPADTSRYYRYQGSLTTPGCYESVTWTVFAEPQKISERQLSGLRQLQYEVGHFSADLGQVAAPQLVDNWRPLQPLHGRVIRQSFPGGALESGPVVAPPRDPNPPAPYVPLGGKTADPAATGAVFNDNSMTFDTPPPSSPSVSVLRPVASRQQLSFSGRTSRNRSGRLDN